MKLEITIGNQQLMFLAVFVAAIAVVGMAGAYNPGGTGGTPSVMGHSVDEIDWSKAISNLYVTGNVGIGTTSPGEKLTVAGTIESTTGGVKFPDGTLQTTAGGFGSWTDKDSQNNALTYNVVYKATSDGFVIFRNDYRATTNAIGYTDSNNPPTTERTYASEHGMDAEHTVMMPVRKDYYWRITTNYQPKYIYWLPFGSGQCVKQ